MTAPHDKEELREEKQDIKYTELLMVSALLLSLNSAFQFQCLLIRIKVLSGIIIDPVS